MYSSTLDFQPVPACSKHWSCANTISVSLLLPPCHACFRMRVFVLTIEGSSASNPNINGDHSLLLHNFLACPFISRALLLQYFFSCIALAVLMIKQLAWLVLYHRATYSAIFCSFDMWSLSGPSGMSLTSVIAQTVHFWPIYNSLICTWNIPEPISTTISCQIRY